MLHISLGSGMQSEIFKSHVSYGEVAISLYKSFQSTFFSPIWDIFTPFWQHLKEINLFGNLPKACLKL